MPRKIVKWQQKLKVKEGALTEYVKNAYGRGGFTKSKKTGNLIIRPTLLKKMAAGVGCSDLTRRRAQLVINRRKRR